MQLSNLSNDLFSIFRFFKDLRSLKQKFQFCPLLDCECWHWRRNTSRYQQITIYNSLYVIVNRWDSINFFSGSFYLNWQCIDCTINYERDSVTVDNRFAEPNDFELLTEIYIHEFQNIRVTVELKDYVADMIKVWVARDINERSHCESLVQNFKFFKFKRSLQTLLKIIH